MNNTIEINGKIFSEDEIKQLISLVNELVGANETLNAQLIAMNAKLENEEKKVIRLTNMIKVLTNDSGNHY
jgi:Ser-tRNA(Ala) deacylase AlaX